MRELPQLSSLVLVKSSILYPSKAISDVALIDAINNDNAQNSNMWCFTSMKPNTITHTISMHCAVINHVFLCPKAFGKGLTCKLSTNGDHKNLKEYGMVLNESNPIATSDTPQSPK
ncbi:hypothetical protein MIDIC_190009 [Alphaproteobacteria bacterium]